MMTFTITDAFVDKTFCFRILPFYFVLFTYQTIAFTCQIQFKAL